MLAAVLNIPETEEQWSIWSYNHRLSHNAIRAAILAQYNVNLDDYQIDPIGTDDIVAWLDRNSQLHDDMNAVLKLQGQDLQDVDLKDKNQKQAWVWLHYLEHNTAEQKLNIGS